MAIDLSTKRCPGLRLWHLIIPLILHLSNSNSPNSLKYFTPSFFGFVYLICIAACSCIPLVFKNLISWLALMLVIRLPELVRRGAPLPGLPNPGKYDCKKTQISIQLKWTIRNNNFKTSLISLFHPIQVVFVFVYFFQIILTSLLNHINEYFH